MTDEQIIAIADGLGFPSDDNEAITFARALFAASIADTAGAKPAPPVAQNYGSGMIDALEDFAPVPAPSVADAAGASDFTHELKTDIDVFAAVLDGRKTYEIRRNDRGFKVGDTLRLRETRYTGQEMRGPEPRPLEYTGREVSRVVSHILDGYGLQPGWVILSFAAGASEGQAVIDCGECACLPGICDKEEALKPAGYVIPQRLQSDDPVISLYRKPEGGARKPLYTHPSAELTALRERVAGMEKDAERWKWLKLQATVGEQHEIMRTPWGKWDEYADAAIAKERS